MSKEYETALNSTVIMIGTLFPEIPFGEIKDICRQEYGVAFDKITTTLQSRIKQNEQK